MHHRSVLQREKNEVESGVYWTCLILIKYNFWVWWRDTWKANIYSSSKYDTVAEMRSQRYNRIDSISGRMSLQSKIRCWMRWPLCTIIMQAYACTDAALIQLWCCCDSTLMLRWCCTDATLMLPTCYTDQRHSDDDPVCQTWNFLSRLILLLSVLLVR